MLLGSMYYPGPGSVEVFIPFMHSLSPDELNGALIAS